MMFGTQAVSRLSPVEHSVPGRSIPIGGAAHCSDGSAGRVARVVRDPRGRLTHLVIRRPGVLARHVLVPCEHIAEIDDGVVLTLRRAELDSLPEHRPDDDISADVEGALRSMELFHDRDDFVAVRVGVANGIVELRGYTRSEARRHEAATIARRVRGVLEVRNHLHADDSIAQQVERVLRADARLAGKAIHAACRFGVVGLRGEVATRAERAVATVLARQIPGVTAINNLLRSAA